VARQRVRPILASVAGRESIRVLVELLPNAAVGVEAFGDPPDASLMAEEESAVETAVSKRVQEFTTGRSCARRALAAIGRPSVPITRGKRGAPQWPAGVVGSITHCDGYRGAAVAENRDLAAIGIDAEPHGVLPDGVRGTIPLPPEMTHMRDLERRHGDLHWDRLLFSAKESVYKVVPLDPSVA
jgi:4'-phosphopantetheinyl transferase EntD